MEFLFLLNHIRTRSRAASRLWFNESRKLKWNRSSWPWVKWPKKLLLFTYSVSRWKLALGCVMHPNGSTEWIRFNVFRSIISFETKFHVRRYANVSLLEKGGASEHTRTLGEWPSRKSVPLKRSWLIHFMVSDSISISFQANLQRYSSNERMAVIRHKLNFTLGWTIAPDCNFAKLISQFYLKKSE